MTEPSIDPAVQPRAAFSGLPSSSVIDQAFGCGQATRRQRLLVLPVLANPLCEHHLVVYASDLSESRLRLIAFSKRESLDPKVPSRDWSELCRADMPGDRLDEFVDLLQDRLDGTPIELRDLDDDVQDGKPTEGEVSAPIEVNHAKKTSRAAEAEEDGAPSSSELAPGDDQHVHW